MAEYILDIEYANVIYEKDGLNFKDFERCTFRHCTFSECVFLAVAFIDCVFINCNFNGTKVNHSAFRSAAFHQCQIREVNFAMCDKLLFAISFDNCILDFSKFYTLKIKGTFFANCSLIAVDFMGADLTEVIFDRCDLYRAEFSKAIACKTDFRTSRNYTIDPEKTKLKKALFSLENAKGLLFKHEIFVS